MPAYNKGTLDAYSTIDTKYLKARTLVLTGSLNVGGNAYISGSLTAATIIGTITTSGVNSITVSGSTNLTGSILLTGSNAVYLSQSGQTITISGSDATHEGLTVAEVRDHTPASHSGSHVSGSGDVISIYKSQIRDINDFTLTAPELNITGSTTSGISGSLVVTGSISGSAYFGPVMRVRTGSATTYVGRRIDFENGGAMIITMSQDTVNDEVVVTLQATGSGGGGGLADTVVEEIVFGSGSSAGVAVTSSRSDHTHGTPTLSPDNALDVSDTATSGSMNSGSKVDHVHRGVLSLSNSGSTELYSRVYVTGSPNISVTQSGQVINFDTNSNSLLAAYITGSTLLSGANITGPTATITTVNSTDIVSTNGTFTNLTGSTISGSVYIGATISSTNIAVVTITGSSIVSGSNIYGPNAVITNVSTTNVSGSTISGSLFKGTNVTVAYVSGSSIVSGSTVLGANGNFVNVNATNITGSTISGSSLLAPTATITNVNATNVTGSTISGSNIYGPNATVTNVYVTNLSGSGTISGSTVMASTLQVASFSPASITATTITGSTSVSGSTVYASILSGSAIKIVGDISGSSFSGPVMSARTGSATTYSRKAINFLQGSGMTVSLADDPTNQEVEVTIATTITGVDPATTIVAETGSGIVPAVGTSISFARADHTHGSPTFSSASPVDVSTSASAGTVNSGSKSDHAHKGVGGLGASGSGLLYGNIYITGSSNVVIASGSQLITVSLPNNVSVTNLTGTTLVSGSDIRGLTATITTVNSTTANLTNINATNVTGSVLSGSNIYGPNAKITNILATNVSGSGVVSGSTLYGSNARIVNLTGSEVTVTTLYANSIDTDQLTINGTFIVTDISATTITGATSVSGSNFLGANATLTNITGSIISGSTIRGASATITNINATNVTGSLLSGSDIRAPTATITTINTTNLNGSGTVSGSLIRGTDISGSHLGISGNTAVTGNLSGSTISGSITMNMDGNARVAVRQNSSGTGYLRRRINLVEGSNITLSLGDDSANEEVDVTITATSTINNGVKGYALVANGGTIAHGLGAVPTYIGLTASGSNPIQFSSTANSTNITVYHTAGGSAGVFWFAV